MSAIAGIFSRSGAPRPPGEIDQMLGVMAMRGPDRTAVWRGDRIELGHGLLVATPEAASENQPFTDPRTGNTIVADIRLDNRAELISKLAFRGCRAHEIGDAELALAAYNKWSTDCGAHLLGAFAFAVWDVRLNELLLVRDHFGVRPLQFYVSDDFFVFASDARAILRVEGVLRTPNRDRLLDYIMMWDESCEVTETFYQSISRLLPAHAMRVTRDFVRPTSYWSLEEPEVLRLPSTRSYIARHDEIMSEAVRCRMRGQDDAAVMLSGGIDSASIATYAADAADAEPVRAVSGVSPKQGDLETSLIADTVSHLSLDLTSVFPQDLNDLCGGYSENLRALENPFDIPMSIVSAVSAGAAAGGMRSLVSGIFANEVAEPSFAHIFNWLVTQHRYLAALGQFHPKGKVLDGLGPRVAVKMSILTAGNKLGLTPILEPRSERRSREALDHALSDAGIVCDPDERERLVHRLTMRQRPSRDIDGPGTARAELFATHYAAAGLERYDRVGANRSIEIRSPFMDKRVVEFWLSLPCDQLMQRGWPKVLLRRSMNNRLPPKVAWNKANEHLGMDFTHSWLDFDPSGVLLDIPSSHAIVDLVDIDSVKKTIRQRDPDPENRRLWLACLAVWLDSSFP